MEEFSAGGEKGLRVVAIGGGNGLSTLLSGFKRFVDATDAVPKIDDLAAIVTVSDDGGSSGRLRDELKMPPPGDIRNCMVALSEDSLLLSKLFRYRFHGSGDLGGHSFGNIFLAALAGVTGDFAEAVRLSLEILASRGHIYPATKADVHLVAELKDGSIVRGESKIGKVGSSVKQLSLEPASCEPMPEALWAIAAADIITLGPGSLFTSLLPPLLVEGVSRAIAESAAVKIFVCNLMTQPGETDRFTVDHHLEIVNLHAREIKFDLMIVNNGTITERQAELYDQEGAEQLEQFPDAPIEGIRIIYDNLLDDGDMVRHDPEKLANLILSCVKTSSPKKVGSI
jgi:uncharacterized cofD-like protein